MSTEGLEALLGVQEHDTKLDQLRHRRDTLAERERRDRARAALDELRERAADVSERRERLARDQKRLQDEAAVLAAKRAEHEALLYDGSITNPRELQDRQAEIDSLARRIGEIEDHELEIMMELEPVEVDLAELATSEADQGGELDAAEMALTAAEAEVDAEIHEVAAARDSLAGSVDGDLLEEYRGLRAGRRGIVVSRLMGRRCGACQLELSAMAVDAIKKNPDVAGRCEECGGILVP